MNLGELLESVASFIADFIVFSDPEHAVIVALWIMHTVRMTTVAMSITKFQEQGGRLDTADLDFDAFRTDPLDADVLRCIAYMHDIEYHTPLYAREFLMTPAAWRDPQYTAFLTIWSYEEYWHGEALGRVLAAHDHPAHDARLVPMREARRRQLDLSPALYWVLGHAVRRFPAVHMTWGAINEWTANAAYNRLAQIADHPVLRELLTRIMRQEGRHAGYYSSHARDLLAEGRRAQQVTRWFLRHQWDIVGSGDVPRIETAFVSAYLFGAGEGTELVERGRTTHRRAARPGRSRPRTGCDRTGGFAGGQRGATARRFASQRDVRYRRAMTSVRQ